MSKYNLVIIGSGLESLILAGVAVQKGLSVALLDSDLKLGGSLAPLEYHGSYIDSLYSQIPHTDENIASLKIIDAELPFFEPIQTLENPKITFEKGHLTPFVGFGDTNPLGMDFISAFTSSEKIKTRLNIPQLIQRLGEKVEIHLGATFTDALVYNKKIISLTIDGKKKYEADHFVFTKHPSDLKNLFPKETFSAKTFSKLEAKDSWAYLNLLCISSSPITENTSCYILYGTQKTPTVCLGGAYQSWGSNNAPVFYSQWITFLNQDTQDLSEDSVQALKEMKRQIKRVYPEAFDSLLFEKIALFESAKSYVDLSTKSFGQLNDFENLSICSHHLISDTHIFAASLKAVAHTLQDASWKAICNPRHEAEAANNLADAQL